MPEDCWVPRLSHAGGMPASSRGSERSADPRITRQTDPTPAGVAQTTEAVGPDPSRAIRRRTRLRPNRGFAAVLRAASAPTATGHSRPLRGREGTQPDRQPDSQTGSPCRADSPPSGGVSPARKTPPPCRHGVREAPAHCPTPITGGLNRPAAQVDRSGTSARLPGIPHAKEKAGALARLRPRNRVVEVRGFEPLTYTLRTYRSPS